MSARALQPARQVRLVDEVVRLRVDLETPVDRCRESVALGSECVIWFLSRRWLDWAETECK